MAVTSLLRLEVLFAITFCIVAEVLMHPENDALQGSSDNNSDGNKRPEEIWSWGYVDNTKSNNQSATTEEPEVCKPYNPTVPNFEKPGRRISEVKCYEYLWNINFREERDRRLDKCFKLHSNVQPSFAIGGRNTLPGEFPHMGAIGWQAVVGSWIFKCGGSLISNKFILTAAHCTSFSLKDTTIADPIPKIVRLGDKYILDKEVNDGIIPEDREIVNIIKHPSYNPPKKYYDIALMELDKDVFFSKYVQPACLWPHFDLSSLGKKASATGWGVVDARSTDISPELQAIVIDLIDTPQCQQLLETSCNRHWCGVEDHQLCAGKLAGGVDACQGDSGGPLQVEISLPTSSQGKIYCIIGVTSFGIGCALPELPGIYTRVSSFIDWIEQNVWPTVHQSGTA